MRRKTTEEFISDAKEVHGDKYSYYKVDYKNTHTKVSIYCNVHDQYFEQTPHNHLQNHGCPQCAINKRANMATKTTQEFINEANKIHGKGYDYSEVEYITTDVPVNIKCSKHGTFMQRPNVFSVDGTTKNDSDLIFDLEVFLHKKNSQYIYKPKISFYGHTECFSKVKIDKFIEKYKEISSRIGKLYNLNMKTGYKNYKVKL